MQYLPASARRYEAGEGAGLQSSLLSLGHRIPHTQEYTAEYNEYNFKVIVACVLMWPYGSFRVFLLFFFSSV
jgi:hypothetical protein